MNKNLRNDLKHSLLKPLFNWKLLIVMAIFNILLIPIFFTWGYIAANTANNSVSKNYFTKFRNWKHYGKMGGVIILLFIVFYLPIGITLFLLNEPTTKLLLYYPNLYTYQQLILWGLMLICFYVASSSVINYINYSSSDLLNLKKSLLSKQFFIRWIIVLLPISLVLFYSNFFYLIYADVGIVNLSLPVHLLSTFINNLLWVYLVTFSFNFLSGAYKQNTRR